MLNSRPAKGKFGGERYVYFENKNVCKPLQFITGQQNVKFCPLKWAQYATDTIRPCKIPILQSC